MGKAFSTGDKTITIASFSLVLLTLAYCSWLVFWRLDEVPGLHADEASFGLLGMEFMRSHVKTFHGLNNYTGSLYPWIASLAFRMAGTGLETLRGIGAVCNLAALAILAGSLLRYRGFRALLAFLLLLLASPQILVNARIAWEVTSFQFLIISIQLSILLKSWHDRRLNTALGLLFMAITSLGVFNHFIFISNILGFTAAAIVLYSFQAKGGDHRLWAAKLVHLALATLFIAAVLFLLKPRVGDAQRQYLVVLCFAIAIAPAVYSFVAQSSEGLCRIAIDTPAQHLYARIEQLKNQWRRLNARGFWQIGFMLTFLSGLAVLLGAGSLSVFHRLYVHSWGLLGSITSVLPLQRVLSARVSPAYFAVSHIFWGLMVVLYMAAMIKSLRHSWRSKMQNQGESDSADLLFFLYPIFCYISLLPLTGRSSERYYIISAYLFLCCLSITASRACTFTLLAGYGKTFQKQFNSLLVGLMFVQIVLAQWTTIDAVVLNPRLDDPFQVEYPGYLDTSYHFADTKTLSDYLQNHGLCTAIDANYFILSPLHFYFAINPPIRHCETGKRVIIDYCEGCKSPVKNFKILSQ
ncbi:MAG: hypothetical protein ER33_05550 [Cyanobium sp. CACIAM 14]|nr:MAG: hypothetical protein ER33_05550 [Cyanobium sp. CACIAM 14]